MLGQTGTRQSNQFLAIGHPEQHSSNRGKQIPSVFRLECGNTRWARCVFLTPAFTVESIWTQLKPFLRSCGCCNFLRSDAYIRSWSLSWFASMHLRWLDSKLRTWKILCPNVQRRRRWGTCILLCFIRHGFHIVRNMNGHHYCCPLSCIASTGLKAAHLWGRLPWRKLGISMALSKWGKGGSILSYWCCMIQQHYLVFKKLQWEKKVCPQQRESLHSLKICCKAESTNNLSACFSKLRLWGSELA